MNSITTDNPQFLNSRFKPNAMTSCGGWELIQTQQLVPIQYLKNRIQISKNRKLKSNTSSTAINVTSRLLVERHYPHQLQRPRLIS